MEQAYKSANLKSSAKLKQRPKMKPKLCSNSVLRPLAANFCSQATGKS